ncbi:hypothetical protein BD779DRAFT_530010 [Infundibulicybe gibba]|nr:hypothetical protein BD779DRAFT_530010 [Infundibulicybe gibba]
MILGGVNRQFYAAAVKARFHEASIFQGLNWVEYELKHLLDPSTARNVKSFSVDSYLLQRSLPRPKVLETHTRTPILTKLKYILRPSSRPQLPVKWSPLSMPCSEMSDKSRIEVYLEIMRNLACLEDFTIFSGYLSKGDDEAPWVHEFWATFAPSLRTLRLVMQTSGFHAFIPPLGIQCTNIRVLHLSSKNFLDVISNLPHLTPVCEFINGLNETLEELHISGSIFLTFDWLFQRLHYFKHLHFLTIDANGYDNGIPAIAFHGVPEFISKHQAGIRYLSLSFSSPIPPFELSELRISNLTSLEITQAALIANHDHAKNLFVNISHSLVELTIQDPLSPSDLFILLSSFPIENCLEMLALSQPSFNADLILLLASYLPRLQSLKLFVGAEDLSLPPTLHDVSSPNNRTSPASLASWGLQDITIIKYRVSEQLILWTVMALVAMCVQSIRSFCGNAHMRIPDPRKKWPRTRGWYNRGERRY